MSDADVYEVLIVGGGKSGKTLAADLALHGALGDDFILGEARLVARAIGALEGRVGPAIQRVGRSFVPATRA